MKRLSFWAHNHKVATRIIIVFIYLILNICGLIVGDLLYSINIELIPAFFYMVICIALLGLLIYPLKKRKVFYKNLYLRQKSADALLLTATFLFIIYSGNSFNSGRSINPLNSAFGITIINYSGAPVSNIYNTAVNKKKEKLLKKENKKHFRSVIKAIREKYKGSTQTEKTIYIILVVLAGLAAIFLLSMLSCSIACSGSEGLAYILLFLGLGGIIYGVAKAIQAITRGKPKKEQAIHLAEK